MHATGQQMHARSKEIGREVRRRTLETVDASLTKAVRREFAMSPWLMSITTRSDVHTRITLAIETALTMLSMKPSVSSKPGVSTSSQFSFCGLRMRIALAILVSEFDASLMTEPGMQLSRTLIAACVPSSTRYLQPERSGEEG